VTKKRKKDPQEAAWGNRLAFLGGIVTSDEPSLIEEGNSDGEEVEDLVPAVKPRVGPPRRPRAQKAKQRRRAVAQRVKKRAPPKESPSARARTRVKQRVDELREEAIRKAMPGIALTLYREGRQYINALDSYSTEMNVQEAGWYMQAAIDAFKVIEKYRDAANVLIFLVGWTLKQNTGTIENLKEMLEEARAYLDRHKDDDIKLLNECDRLEKLIDARTIESSD